MEAKSFLMQPKKRSMLLHLIVSLCLIIITYMKRHKSSHQSVLFIAFVEFLSVSHHGDLGALDSRKTIEVKSDWIHRWISTCGSAVQRVSSDRAPGQRIFSVAWPCPIFTLLKWDGHPGVDRRHRVKSRSCQSCHLLHWPKGADPILSTAGEGRGKRRQQQRHRLGDWSKTSALIATFFQSHSNLSVK